jgi:YVTN family beta-propeller protein
MHSSSAMLVRLTKIELKPYFLSSLILIIASAWIMIMISLCYPIAAVTQQQQPKFPEQQPTAKVSYMTEHNESYSGPIGVAINQNTNMVYVAGGPSGAVSVIDGKTNTVVKTIKVGQAPSGIGLNPNTNMVYVANSFSNSTSVIDGKTDMLVKIVKVGSGPTGVAVDIARNLTYVTNEKSNTVSVVDGKTNTVVKTIKIV